MIGQRKLIVTFLILLAFTSVSFSGLAQPPHEDGGGDIETLTFEGYCDVGSSVEESFEKEKSIEKVEFMLMWEDDEGSDSEPDTFTLTTSDGMHEPQSGSDSSGMVSQTWEEHGLNNSWDMVVTCDSAGPTPVPIGPIGLITQDEADPGNSWTLVVTITYASSMGGMPPHIQAVLESPVFKVHVALMVMSVFLFLGTGLFAGVFIFTRKRWSGAEAENTFTKKMLTTPILLIFLVIVTWLIFFTASVPIGMQVSAGVYGWDKAWTGIPAIWNPEAFDMTNADNTSFLALFFWAIPMYINRAQIMRSKYYKKLFGWSSFAMKRAEKAPDPRLSNKELAIIYCLLGIFIWALFMVQPHG